MAFVAYRTWTTGEIATAAMFNEQLRDNGVYLKGAIEAISYANVTVSRAIDAVYQNSTKVRIIIISFELDAGEKLEFLTDDNAAPSVVVAAVGGTEAYCTMTVIVQPNHYYELHEVAGAPSFVDWHEWDFH